MQTTRSVVSKPPLIVSTAEAIHPHAVEAILQLSLQNTKLLIFAGQYICKITKYSEVMSCKNRFSQKLQALKSSFEHTTSLL